MTLRPYQRDAVESVERGWAEASKQLLVAPTGAGKTIMFAALAAREPRRTLILAHREELIGQAAEKIERSTGIKTEIEKAERAASPSARVVVASVQTLQGDRLLRWPRDHFALVVADEAHHAVADTWQRVLNHFDPDTDTHTLGVTATPDRGDKRQLGSYFERVAAEIKLVDLIKDGYLAPITIRTVPLEIDLTKVSSTAGDLDAGELGSALDPYLDQIAAALKGHAPGRRTLAFLPLIATSKKFAEACLRAGLRAEHVDGYDKQRAEKLERFASFEFDVLTNAMLLTEGFDDPGIDCILVLRPTRSRPLYAQMIGRGTRVEPLKDDLLILDMLWMHERHSLTRPAHLVASSDAEADAITELAEERAGSGEGDGQIDLLDAVSDAAAKREEKLAEELKRMATRRGRYITAEEFALRHHELAVAEFEPSLPWETKPLTDKQAFALKRAGVDPETVRGRGHASKLLDIHFRGQALTLASEPQRKMLAKYGHPSPETASIVEFRKFMKEMRA